MPDSKKGAGLPRPCYMLIATYKYLYWLHIENSAIKEVEILH